MRQVRSTFFSSLFLLSGLLTGCQSSPDTAVGKLTVGVVSYEADVNLVQKYEPFKDYLSEQTKAVVELEPTLNELRAVEQIQNQEWSIVFAPPGVAAIAMDQAQYIPLFPLEGPQNLRSVLVVREDSLAQDLSDLSNEIVALGEPGSAAGYYLPLYDLYGLTLGEIRFAPTPQTILDWVSQGEVAAGAMSEDDFQRYRSAFSDTNFRALHTSRPIPPGVVLLGPTIERNQQQQIETFLASAPAHITGDAGYIPNAAVPDYTLFSEFVEKVKPLETRLREQPVILTLEAE